jgi:hypothetical protein
MPGKADRWQFQVTTPLLAKAKSREIVRQTSQRRLLRDQGSEVQILSPPDHFHNGRNTVLQISQEGDIGYLSLRMGTRKTKQIHSIGRG